MPLVKLSSLPSLPPCALKRSPLVRLHSRVETSSSSATSLGKFAYKRDALQEREISTARRDWFCFSFFFSSSQYLALCPSGSSAYRVGILRRISTSLSTSLPERYRITFLCVSTGVIVIVGATKTRWRVCDACEHTPRFSRRATCNCGPAPRCVEHNKTFVRDLTNGTGRL